MRRYGTQDAVPRRDLRILLLSTGLTLVARRVALHLSPHSDFDFGAHNGPHLFPGLLLMVAGRVPLARCRGPTRRLDPCLVTFGVGLGMALDEWVYLIATDEQRQLPAPGLWGGVVVVGLACLYALPVARARLRRGRGAELAAASMVDQ